MLFELDIQMVHATCPSLGTWEAMRPRHVGVFPSFEEMQMTNEEEKAREGFVANKKMVCCICGTVLFIGVVR